MLQDTARAWFPGFWFGAACSSRACRGHDTARALLGRGFQGWRDMQFACLPWGCDDESAKVELALAAMMGRG